MSNRSKKSTESLRTRAEILNIPLRCGGFYDLESFRKEVPEAYHINNEEAQAIILENMDQRINLPVEAKIKLDNYGGPAEKYVDNELQNFTHKSHYNEMNAREEAKRAQRIANEEAQLREREVREERNKRPSHTTVSYAIRDPFNDPFEFNRLRLYGRDYDTVSYLAKERIKRELKDELEEERRRKARQREINNLWKPAAKRAPRAKSVKKSKSKSTRAKSPKKTKATKK